MTKTGNQYWESGIRSAESRIQDCPGFPYMGRDTDAIYCENGLNQSTSGGTTTKSRVFSLSLSYKFQLLSWINFAPNKIEEIEVIFS